MHVSGVIRRNLDQGLTGPNLSQVTRRHVDGMRMTGGSGDIEGERRPGCYLGGGYHRGVTMIRAHDPDDRSATA